MERARWRERERESERPLRERGRKNAREKARARYNSYSLEARAVLYISVRKQEDRVSRNQICALSHLLLRIRAVSRVYHSSTHFECFFSGRGPCNDEVLRGLSPIWEEFNRSHPPSRSAWRPRTSIGQSSSLRAHTSRKSVRGVMKVFSQL